MSINFKTYMDELDAMPIDEQIQKVAKDMRATPDDMLCSMELAAWINQNKGRIIELSADGSLDPE